MVGETKTRRTLQDIVTVQFPRDLSLSDSEQLLDALAKILHGRATYRYEVLRSVDPLPENTTTTLQTLAGMITRFSPYASVGFNLCRNDAGVDSNLEAFNCLQFATPVGYELDEIGHQEILFMDALRTHISDYFAKRQA